MKQTNHLGANGKLVELSGPDCGQIGYQHEDVRRADQSRPPALLESSLDVICHPCSRWVEELGDVHNAWAILCRCVLLGVRESVFLVRSMVSVLLVSFCTKDCHG